jgi:serine protease Do
MAQRVATQILKTGHVSRAWLGLSVQDVTPELAQAMHLSPGSGALVNSVAADGPSYRANIRSGDVIAAVGGHPVRDGHDLIRETISHDVGQAVQLEIVRGGQHYGTGVTLAERPESAIPPVPAQQQSLPHHGLGLVVRDLAPQQAAQLGLSAKPLPAVTQVTPGSPADREGLRVGDVIVEANGIADPTSTQVADLARSGTLLLRVKRGDRYFYAALRK